MHFTGEFNPYMWCQIVKVTLGDVAIFGIMRNA